MDLCNAFLTSKERQMQQGELQPATAARVFGTSIGVIMQHYADLDVERADTFLGLGVHVRTMSTAVGAGGTQKEAGQSR